jgi:hypothetical protein
MFYSKALTNQILRTPLYKAEVLLDDGTPRPIPPESQKRLENASEPVYKRMTLWRFRPESLRNIFSAMSHAKELISR